MARTSKQRGLKDKSPVSQPARSASTSIPHPFKLVAASSSLHPFVSTLPTDHIYAVHLDRNSTKIKKQAFAVPLILNGLIIAGLCYRIYCAAPIYLSLAITVFNYDTAYHVDPWMASKGDIFTAIIRRFFLMMTDYALFWLLGSWPREFLFGSVANRFVGPLGWRMNIWFDEEEVIVRRGRGWDRALLQDVNESNRAWRMDEELLLKYKIEPAMRQATTSRTGLSLLDNNWDLDYHGMSDAHRLLNDGRAELDDLQDLVLVYYHNQWLVWHVHEPQELDISDPQQEAKLHRFRDLLKELGREDVFFRWIEIVQYETSQPGGFTEGKRGHAVRQLRDMLIDKGVDYPRFWQVIDGQRGLPGFD
jgi:hypothetical protein